MSAKYTVKRTADSQFMFNLQAANGEVILTSERYTTKQSALKGVESVKVNSSLDSRYRKELSSRSEPTSILSLPTARSSARARCTPRRVRETTASNPAR